ncbi:MAG: hypothetical protein RIQ71_2101 [Verrucomicrobiota bacterium]|jgi:hypothetical protein
MPWIKESLPRRAWASFIDFFASWWKEANMPLHKSGLSPGRALLRRFMVYVPVVVLLAAVVGGAGLYFFTGWRAGDLARKAMDNARQGNLTMARVQIMSANNLRPDNSAVKRALVYVQSRFNDPASLALWEELAAKGTDLSADETGEWARLAASAGTEEQFARAMAAFEAGGDAAKVASIRSSRSLRRGNLADSIAQTRKAAADDPALKLELLGLLLRRHAPMLNSGSPNPDDVKGGEEIIALVDGLQGTVQGNQAIAMALGAFPQPPAKIREWALAALEDSSVNNPALLPAAQSMVASGEAKASDYAVKFSAAFAGAAPAKQALLAAWFNRQGMHEQALTLITPKKAAQDTDAYIARAETLAAMGKWEELAKLGETPCNAPPSVRLATRALAAHHLGKSGEAEKALADALRAGAGDGGFGYALAAAEDTRHREVADEIIIAFCGDAQMAANMFSLARERFGRRGQFASLAAAYAAAAKAAPDAPSVQDFRLRSELLKGKNVSLEKTSAAVAASPADQSARFTHALALLRAGRPADALGVFHDVDIFVDRLPPGDKAVAIALYRANGMDRTADAVSRNIDTSALEPGEFALIAR